MTNNDKYIVLKQISNTITKTKEININTGFSFGKIQKIKDALKEGEYINHDFSLTTKGLQTLEETRVETAVIYAAGFGSRLRPITNTTPKPLIKIKNKPIIEYALEYLRDKKYKKVFIVVGHLKEKFNYLEEKYENAEIIYNNLFSKMNNISSLYSVLDRLSENTLFIEGDSLWKENLFPENIEESIVFGEKGRKENEWTLIKRGKYATGYKLNGDGPLWGNGYALSKGDIEKIQDIFKNISLEEYKDCYAEEIFWKNKMKMEIKYISQNSRIEIDTIEDLKKVEPQYLIKSFSNVMQCIKIVHHIDEEDIKNFSAIKGGLTNDTYKYQIKGEWFVVRFPREETNKNIDRHNERLIVESIKDFNIGVETYYINDEAGVLITKLMHNAKSFKKTNRNIQEVSLKLKAIHNSSIKARKTLEPLALFKTYTMVNSIQDKFAADKEEEIIGLIKKYYKDQQDFVLCHNDLIEGNIIWNSEEVKIIDWELSANNDPYWDIASLFMENNFDVEHEKIFQSYYGMLDLKKVTDFKRIITFVWLAWCYQYDKFNDGLQRYHDRTVIKFKELYGN